MSKTIESGQRVRLGSLIGGERAVISEQGEVLGYITRDQLDLGPVMTGGGTVKLMKGTPMVRFERVGGLYLIEGAL